MEDGKKLRRSALTELTPCFKVLTVRPALWGAGSARRGGGGFLFSLIRLHGRAILIRWCFLLYRGLWQSFPPVEDDEAEEDEDDYSEDEGGLRDGGAHQRAQQQSGGDQSFILVVSELVSTGHEEGHPAESLLMEIKGCKFAQNKVHPLLVATPVIYIAHSLAHSLGHSAVVCGLRGRRCPGAAADRAGPCRARQRQWRVQVGRVPEGVGGAPGTGCLGQRTTEADSAGQRRQVRGEVSWLSPVSPKSLAGWP